MYPDKSDKNSGWPSLEKPLELSDNFSDIETFFRNPTKGIAMKYTVLKNEDIDKYLTDEEKQQLANICKQIDFCRAINGIGDGDRGKNFNLKPKGKNVYLVINTDEPYVEQIIEIMKSHGHWG